jgi:hypothetical protein
MDFTQASQAGRFSRAETFPHGAAPHKAAGDAAGRRPPFLSADLARLETLAHLMDTAFVIPGINRRVGFDALIGLVPVIGDVAGMVISSFIVYEAKRLGAPRWLLARMGLNVAFDGLIGAVPVAGDLFDAAFKANRRNVRLLRRWLERSGGLRPTEIDGTATRIDG